MSTGATHACRCGAHQAAAQSMAEMDFEKGLWGAASDGNVIKIRELIRKGNDPNSSDPYGYTALHYAARGGHLDAVRELLSSGACPEAQTHGGATPAHRAAYAGHGTIVWALLVRGAETIVDSDGDTVAHKVRKAFLGPGYGLRQLTHCFNYPTE